MSRLSAASSYLEGAMRIMAHELGRVEPPTDWLQVAKSNGISENTYWQRVHRLGMSEREAATKPLHERRIKNVKKEASAQPQGARRRSQWDGIVTRPEIARRYGIHPDSIRSWSKRHPGHGLAMEEIAQIIAANKEKRNG